MKIAFWNTVIDCMIEFFELERNAAESKIRSFLEEYAASEDLMSRGDITYHAEPIHIASDLIGQEITYTEAFYRRYKELQDENLKRRKSQVKVLWLEKLFTRKQVGAYQNLATVRRKPLAVVVQKKGKPLPVQAALVNAR